MAERPCTGLQPSEPCARRPFEAKLKKGRCKLGERGSARTPSEPCARSLRKAEAFRDAEEAALLQAQASECGSAPLARLCNYGLLRIDSRPKGFDSPSWLLIAILRGAMTRRNSGPPSSGRHGPPHMFFSVSLTRRVRIQLRFQKMPAITTDSIEIEDRIFVMYRCRVAIPVSLDFRRAPISPSHDVQHSLGIVPLAKMRPKLCASI